MYRAPKGSGGRYTFPADATPAEFEKIAAGLVVLAKQVDGKLTTI